MVTRLCREWDVVIWVLYARLIDLQEALIVSRRGKGKVKRHAPRRPGQQMAMALQAFLVSPHNKLVTPILT